MEGPYGHSAGLHQFESVLLVAGGTGFSAVNPYIQEHLQRLEGQIPTRTRTIQLVLTTRKAAFIRHLCDNELQAARRCSNVTMEFFSTADKLPQPSDKRDDDSFEGHPHSPGGISAGSVGIDDKKCDGQQGDGQSDVIALDIKRGRPNVTASIRDFARAHAMSAKGGERTAVLVCGPAGMADEARAAVLEMNREGLNVEYFEEVFSW